MWGGSAFGHTQWTIADQKKPNIDAFIIQIASTNFRKMFYPGNAFSLESAVYWAIKSSGGKGRKVKTYNLEKGVNTLPIIKADDIAYKDTNFYNDWLLNKDNDAYWDRIDGHGRAEPLQVPALLMAGWYDPFLPTQLDDFIKINNKHKRLIIGPWTHADSIKLPGDIKVPPYRNASLAPSIPWFDFHLGFNKKNLDMPPVKIYVMGLNKWRNENEWPLARAQYVLYYLHSNGNANSLHGNGYINNNPPTVKESPDIFAYDPMNPTPSAGGAMFGKRSGIKKQNKIEARQDVLVYSTKPLIKSVEVTGPITALLYVNSSAPSTDFTVKLVDVHPNGSAYNISDGIIRREYKNTKKPIAIQVELWPTSNVFLKGHQIRLEISSSNFPRYDRNTNTGDVSPTAITTEIANQTVYHSKQYPSRIVLPIIPY